MNKLQASQIIQAYQDYRHGDDYSLYPMPEFGDINDALDLAVKELGKPDGEITKRQKKDDYYMATRIGHVTDDVGGYVPVKLNLLKPIYPSFAGTCTKCGEPAENPEYTLCKSHFDRWTNSKLTRTNYTHLVHIDSPKEVREYYGIGDIYENKGECPKCHDIIESRNHYDYVKCSCGHSFIDGGSDYSRRNADLINLSVGFNQK